MNAKRIVALAFAFFVTINGFVITAAASPADIMSTEIVVVVDVSGSVAEYDAGYGVKDGENRLMIPRHVEVSGHSLFR